MASTRAFLDAKRAGDPPTSQAVMDVAEQHRAHP